MTRNSKIKNLICISLLALPPLTVRADDLTYDIRGVGDPMLTNVRRYVDVFQLATSARRNSDREEQLIEDAENRARAALRPFGYYSPTINSELTCLES